MSREFVKSTAPEESESHTLTRRRTFARDLTVEELTTVIAACLQALRGEHTTGVMMIHLSQGSVNAVVVEEKQVIIPT